MTVLSIDESIYIVPMKEGRIQLRREDGQITIIECPEDCSLLKKLFKQLNQPMRESKLFEELDWPESELRDIVNQLQSRGVIHKTKQAPGKQNTNSRTLYDSQALYFSLYSKSIDESKQREALSSSTLLVVGGNGLTKELLSNLTESKIGSINLIWCNNVAGNSDNQDLNTYKSQVQELGVNLIEEASLEEIRQNQVELEEHLKDSQLLILPLENPLVNLSNTINETAVSENTRWLKVGIRGQEGFIGPTVIPGKTACEKCYRIRLESNVQHYEEYLAFQNHLDNQTDRKKFGSPPVFTTTIAALASWEIILVLTCSENLNITPNTYGSQVRLDFNNMTLSNFEIPKIPRCPVCGSSEEKTPPKNIWEQSYHG